MTSRTNYYKTVTQIFHFDEHVPNEQAKLNLPPPAPVEKEIPKKETFYVDAEEEYEDDDYDDEFRPKGNNPQVFGPPLWFSLHNASAYYPEKASPYTPSE